MAPKSEVTNLCNWRRSWSSLCKSQARSYVIDIYGIPMEQCCLKVPNFGTAAEQGRSAA